MYHWNTRVFGRIRGLIRIYIYMYTRIKKSFVYVYRKKGGDRWFHCARCIDSLHDYHSRGMINRVAKARLAANCVKYTIDRNWFEHLAWIDETSSKFRDVQRKLEASRWNCHGKWSVRVKGKGWGAVLAGDETKKQRKRDTVEEVIFRKVYRRFIFKRRKRREQMEISIGIWSGTITSILINWNSKGKKDWKENNFDVKAV